jgi:hypothetical protein
MKVIAQKTKDQNGAPVPYSSDLRASNKRSPLPAVTNALLNAIPGYDAKTAVADARRAIEELRQIGCLEETEKDIPKVANGKANGVTTRKDLIARWDLAPWASQPGVAQSEPSIPSDVGGE